MNAGHELKNRYMHVDFQKEGAIQSAEIAETRCEYLSGFDNNNTLLYSGSYSIVGTMDIRISYRLDGEI